MAHRTFTAANAATAGVLLGAGLTHLAVGIMLGALIIAPLLKAVAK